MNNKIVCVGRNYAAHAEELGNEVPSYPLIFLKPFSSLIKSGEKIVCPPFSGEMHHEVELVLLIGKKIKNVAPEEAPGAISGYAVGLDMTLRDVQSELKKKGHPWTLAKCFDTSAVISDFKDASEYKLSGKERITLSVNNQVRQNSSLELMIHSPVELVSYISSVMTLDEGDLIYTGTPAGVGKVEKKDIITAEIENIGKLETEIT